MAKESNRFEPGDTRKALLIANSKYSDLPDLPSAVSGAHALAEVLGDPAIGGWDAQLLVDQSAEEIRRGLVALSGSHPVDSKWLVYLAGHAFASKGRLYYLPNGASADHLLTTALPVRVLADAFREGRAGSSVVFLDCMFSEVDGGQPETALADEELIHTPGLTVMSASGLNGVALEASVPDSTTRESLFTRAVVAGLATGEADLDADGEITVQELYDYVRSSVLQEQDELGLTGPRQVPTLWQNQTGSSLVIARAENRRTPHVDREHRPGQEGDDARETPALSSSLASALSVLEDGAKDLTAFELAAHVVEKSTDLSGGRVEAPSLDGGPSDAVRHPVGQWLIDVQRLYRSDRVDVINERLLLCGLALLDSDLRRELERDGFLRALERTMEPRAAQLLAPTWRNAWERPDTVPILSDRPATVDRLGRRAFAGSLATRIQDEYDTSLEEGSPGAFLIHVYGPWGSGKTSFLNFVSEELKRLSTPWIVVRFNAWQFERIGPPWWGLIQAVMREGLRDPWPTGWWHDRGWWASLRKGRTKDIRRSWRLALRDFLWRLRLGWVAYLVVPALAIGLWYAVSNHWLQPDIRKMSDVKDAATAAAALVTVIVALVGAVRGLSRSLTVSTARGAGAFLANTRDPMLTLKRRFRRLITTLERPVAIFIDDLDRCQAQYVVDLLHGVQTLLLDEPVTYVVAADGRWLYDSYATVYSDFAQTVQEPGRPLGHLFLEKIFQLSVPVPTLSRDLQQAFWQRLLIVRGDSDEVIRKLEDDADETMQKASNPSEVYAMVESSADRPADEQLALRAAAVRRLATPEMRKRTEHMLTPFGHLLDPNPRAIKRLVNAYGIERDRRLLESRPGSDNAAVQEPLVLWTILRMRWPLLAAYLARCAVSGSERPPEPELAGLFASHEVQDVINGRGVGVALTWDAIRKLEGLSATAGETATGWIPGPVAIV